jgi:hypothetical protein
MSYQALTQPSSIGRVLDSGIRLFVASLKPVLLLLVVTALVNILMQYAMFQTMLPVQQLATEEAMARHMAAIMPQLLGISVIMWLISIILYNAILSRIGAVAKGESSDLYDSMITGIRKVAPVFVAAILYFLATSVGLVLLVIPGLILMITLLFFQVLIVVDDEGIIASLKRSHNLVWGNYWRTTAVILIPFFIIYALIIVVAIVAGMLGAMTAAEAMPGHMHTTFGLMDVVIAGLSVLMVPFIDAIFIAQVNDLKLRKSGADLEQRMSA